jgi:hypothetical protein
MKNVPDFAPGSELLSDRLPVGKAKKRKVLGPAAARRKEELRLAKQEEAREEAREEALSRGYKMIGTYVNCDEKIHFVCPNSHDHFASWGSFRQKKGCKKCARLFVTHEDVEAAFNAKGSAAEYQSRSLPR